ncbi:MAG: hypothetical protein ACYDHY_16430 [Acidiferrobacterales bacterium]
MHSVATPLADLATIVPNTYRAPHAGESAPGFAITTTPPGSGMPGSC